MAGNFSKKTQEGNKHQANLTSAQFVHFDGTTAKPVDIANPRRLLRIIVCTKGVAFTVRSGSRQIGVFSTTSAEGTYNFGEYCENGLTIDGVSGTGSVNVALDV